MVQKKKGENSGTGVFLSRFFVYDDRGWQGRGILALRENVRLQVEAGRRQVFNYKGEVHEEVWQDDPL